MMDRSAFTTEVEAKREAVRQTLRAYAQTISDGLVLAENERERDQLVTSVAQVESAKRVLWMVS